mgnify:CR=1 FL=1
MRYKITSTSNYQLYGKNVLWNFTKGTREKKLDSERRYNKISS